VRLTWADQLRQNDDAEPAVRVTLRRYSLFASGLADYVDGWG